MPVKSFGLESLRIDAGAELQRISRFIRDSVRGPLRKQGAVVAVSGGVDSATTLALCVQALGRERVYALMMPERESDPAALTLSQRIVDQLGVRHEVIDITRMLDASGCYALRDAAIRTVFADYRAGYKSKICLGGADQDGARLLYFNLVVEDSTGLTSKRRLTGQQLRQIVAVTNMKQRTRKAMEYFHADRLNYAVAGTANMLEHDQGFFVKLGDGAADLKPIAHLYKTQVNALAQYLHLPESVRQRIPTSDTYSLGQSQEEFFFGLPLLQLDVILFGVNQGYPLAAIAQAVALEESKLTILLRELRQKRVAARSLHMAPLMLEPVVYV